MNKPKIVVLLPGLTIMLTLFCRAGHSQSEAPVYKPESKELYDAIVHMDSVWEDYRQICPVR